MTSTHACNLYYNFQLDPYLLPEPISVHGKDMVHSNLGIRSQLRHLKQMPKLECTMLPQQLKHKMVHLGLIISQCNWFFGHTYKVVCWALFCSLCWPMIPTHNSNFFIKFVDDITVAGIISNGDETNNRTEVSCRVIWCTHNFSLNVESLTSVKFLAVHITDNLLWSTNTTFLIKKGHQHLFFLHKLKEVRVQAPIRCSFYRGTTESIQTSCITVWCQHWILP